MHTRHKGQTTPTATAVSRPATLKDIAERCGVSHVTVSRALRHDRRKVSEATYAQIWAVARELHYDPNLPNPARRLAMQRNNQPVLNRTIALFVPLFRDMGAYFGAIIDGIMEEVESEQFALLSVFPGTIPSIIARGDIDGALILLSSDQQDLVAMLRAEAGFANRPVVALIREMANEANVLVDDYQGGYLAVRHLLELGHRALLFGHYNSPTHQQRLRGAQQACREHSLDPAGALHFFEWNSNERTESEAAFLRLRQAYPEITAVFAPNDMAAIEIAGFLGRLGLSIPHDISLVGFDDNLALPDATGHNRLTSVHLDLNAVGRQSVRLLIGLIRGEITDRRTEILPVHLAIRDTTAPPRR
jgi:DNA-binding LacI/PurR family transcriptional regulator